MLAKALRFELLRWHLDKFDGRVLGQIVSRDDSEAVRLAAKRVARILTTSIEKIANYNVYYAPVKRYNYLSHSSRVYDLYMAGIIGCLS